jgi:hypothetical protein
MENLNFITIGFSMKCTHIICKAKKIENGFLVGGLIFPVSSDFIPDNKENRKKLNNECKILNQNK